MKQKKVLIAALLLTAIFPACGAWRTSFSAEQRQYGKAIGDGKLVVSPETETFEIEGNPEFISKILELIGRDDLPPALKPMAPKVENRPKKKRWFGK